MTDNQLIDFVATQLEAASASAGWNYIVLQKDQPTMEGIPTAPTIFFEKLFDHPYGWPIAKFSYIVEQNVFNENETQLYETTFQISTLAIQNPEDLTLPTASDIANYMKQYIGSRHVSSLFQAASMGILRVTDVRNPYFKDDRNQFEAHPTFDFTVLHNRQINFEVPAADRAEENLVKAVA